MRFDHADMESVLLKKTGDVSDFLDWTLGSGMEPGDCPLIAGFAQTSGRFQMHAEPGQFLF